MTISTRMFTRMIAIAAAGVLAFTAAAEAQPCTCQIVNGCKVVTIYDAAGNPINTETICPTTGSGTFGCDVGEPPPPTGPLNVTVAPVSINSTAFSTTLGQITTALDPTRTSSSATITSNSTTSRYPATVKFSFYATVTVAGATYFSREELRFINRNAQSFNPFNNENFVLENDAVFVVNPNIATSPTAFLLHAGSQVTLN